MKKYVAGLIVIGSLIMSGCGGSDNMVDLETITIGGVVSGLSNGGSSGIATLSLVAADGVEELVVNNGAFQFEDKLEEGENYTVTVVSDPMDRTCEITAGASGSAVGPNMTDIVIECHF